MRLLGRLLRVHVHVGAVYPLYRPQLLRPNAGQGDHPPWASEHQQHGTKAVQRAGQNICDGAVCQREVATYVHTPRVHHLHRDAIRLSVVPTSQQRVLVDVHGYASGPLLGRQDAHQYGRVARALDEGEAELGRRMRAISPSALHVVQAYGAGISRHVSFVGQWRCECEDIVGADGDPCIVRTVQ
eukprot:CAMPEP_0173262728 /NCGR_PEP_ID=MMETSP1142-20121109/26946_1 /TAXON_ID=483371 /ORGANISM="non described non described, Strain CCMP2298" /LENGTH=184 /DNA_ID=CAMNT_0014197919 /DNA_START=60 /DNA_END=615 /DNA_ORIENTATION=-